MQLIQPRTIYLTLLILCLLPNGLYADAYSEGQTAIAEGDYKKAYQLLSAAAKKGEANAQYGLGVLYNEGWAVDKNEKTAFSWFQQAAQQDYPPAQFNLGNAYYKGLGVEANIPEAEIWWDIAAHNGHSQAQFNLGMLLFNNGGADEAMEQGIAWTRAAAKQGIKWADDQLAAIDEPISYTLISFDASREPARSEARITTLQPESYTIHLLSTESLSSAIDAIRHDGLEGRAMIYRSAEQAAWFGIIYGVYESEDGAQQTIASMKPHLQKMGPTVHSIKTIQEKIVAWRISIFSK
ncbi:MAG: hypothetical protein L3J28_15145 [Candidatus Polarisedimenticolaceae bacterium]|nr:hypothetical protein [Candidatus Polarisedimenticolaceae bacterium]